MQEKRHELRRAQQEFQRLTEERKEQQIRVARLTSEYEEIAQDLEDLETGRYTPPELRPIETDNDPNDTVAGEGLRKAAELMHKRQGGGVPFDAGAQAPIDSLIEFGLTAKQVEMIVNSELAARVGEIKTVGHLEKAIRENDQASRMIKGIGVTKFDKVTDAIVAFRQVNPVPSREDEEPEADPVPAADEQAISVDAGGQGGGVAIISGKVETAESGTTFVAEARWTFATGKPQLRMARAGEGDTREVAIREAVRRVLVDTRESPQAPPSWVADLEEWLRNN